MKKRHSIHLLLVAAALLLATAACTKDELADGNRLPEEEYYDKGYNLSADGRTYEVYNANGLLAWNKAVQGNLSLNCTLTDNIDLTGKEWTPIGIDFYNQYIGTFDGKNHTITGLTVTGSDRYAGLFGNIGVEGTVKNVVLEGVQITSDNSSCFVGGVVGLSYGTVENCSVSGSVSSSNSGSRSGSDVGGVVGYQEGGFISGCSSSATVKGTVLAGGVAGGTDTGATLTGCYATGSVTLESNGPDTYYAGNVVGRNRGVSTLIACYTTGSVTGSGSGTIYVGGITGFTDGSMTACYHAKGTVSVSGPDGTIGGVTGRKCNALYAPVITACYWGSNPDAGVGCNQSDTTGGTTKVDGANVKWADAVAQMNAALSGSGWRYELTGALPTLKKQ